MRRPLAAADIDTIVDIHATSWRPQEISVKLGRDFLSLFYEAILDDEDAYCFVFQSDDRVIGYAVGFADYPRFNARFKGRYRIRLYGVLLRGVLSGKIGIADVLNLFQDQRKFRNATFGTWHLGALALATEFKGTDRGREAIRSAIEGVLLSLRERGAPGVSIVCDDENTPMKKHLVKQGFTEIDVVKMFGRRIVLYEIQYGTREHEEGRR